MGTVVHFATAWRERPSILPNPALLPAASTAYSKPVMRRYVVSHKIIVNGLLTWVNQRFTHRASNNGATVVANIKYFTTCGADQVELTNIWHSGAVSTKAKEFSGKCQTCGERHQAQRAIEYKKFASKHECDARCINATGRVMRCECSCGGKNHGKGAFNCVAA